MERDADSTPLHLPADVRERFLARCRREGLIPEAALSALLERYLEAPWIIDERRLFAEAAAATLDGLAAASPEDRDRVIAATIDQCTQSIKRLFRNQPQKPC